VGREEVHHAGGGHLPARRRVTQRLELQALRTVAGVLGVALYLDHHQAAVAVYSQEVRPLPVGGDGLLGDDEHLVVRAHGEVESVEVE